MVKPSLIASTGFIVIGILLVALYFVPLSGPQQVSGEPKIEYKVYTITDVVSAAYKVYGRPDLGMWVAKVVITNVGTAPAYNLKISYSIDVYSPESEGGRYPVLLPGSTVVDLYYPIISSEVAKLTTPTPSRVNIKITYTDPRGEPREILEKRPINILGKNDFLFTSLPPEENMGTFYDVFNNYPLIAVWVTPTDEVVVQYADLGNKLAGGAGAAISDEEAIKSIKGMWELSVYNNIQYKTEPEAFWTGKISQYVKYPRDVLRDKAATCLDSTIFFASIAMSQGLNAYIVLMPGHAFVVIELPKSGQLIPIETTLLNDRPPFEVAVRKGLEVLREALSGPHIFIDIKKFQALGLTPPELEKLPPDTLQKWGITTPQQPPPTPTPTPPPPQPSPTPTPTPGMQTYVNPEPKWSISYPSSWEIDASGADPSFGEVWISSKEHGDLVVVWIQGYSVDQVRQAVEDWLRQYGSLRVLEEKGTTVSGGVPATFVFYSLDWGGGSVDWIVARYFNYGNYGFAVMYMCASNDNNAVRAFEGVVSTFRLG
ncbi:MAG: cysteine protease [Thermoprotei archaeon]|nr:cysteine protease [Thermoprotei archaeon]